MRKRIRVFIKNTPLLMNLLYIIARKFLLFIGLFIPVKKKSMVFVSLSGRNFDDSPKAIYEEVLKRSFFNDWELIWAFKNPNTVVIPRGKKVQFGNIFYWLMLLRTFVWVGNGGLDLGLNLNRKKNIIVNTWHGSAIKKGEGEENSNSVLKKYRSKRPVNYSTIHCVQNDFDLKIFARLFNSDESTFLRCGLPRNDILITYTKQDNERIKKQLGIPLDKSVLLYMPTYREYLIDNNEDQYIAPPLNIAKWKYLLSDKYVLLIRAHYAITASLQFEFDDFVYNVSDYSPLSDLYSLADILISDYSSAFCDYSILEKPMRCFAYDLQEYEEKRGLYYELSEIMPCPIHSCEDELIDSILHIDYKKDCEATRSFKKKFATFYGSATATLVDAIEKRIIINK